MLFERLLELGVRFGIAAQQQAPGRVLVEPMHRHRPALEPEGQAVEMILQADRATPRTIDRQAHGLVDDQGLAVQEQHSVC